MNPSGVRVRFAPSPTGHLHIGSARTALYNWLYARKTGGVFILRIEDTDALRSTKESYESIIDALEWLGLDWDEGPGKGGDFGPYVQSARLVLYHSEAERLIASGDAYPCFCTKEDLEEMRSVAAKTGAESKYDRRCRNLPREEVAKRLNAGTAHVVRFKMPEGETVFHDIVRGRLAFDNEELDDFVLIKTDGKPTYNFAAVVDDAKMQVTHVIRGDDHIPNTPKQVLLYKSLGYKIPKFAHLPMILGPDRSRLSKRHGATSVQEFRRMGYMGDGLINYLALLGWAYDDKTEFFTRESLIKKFSLKKVSKNPAAFDIEKLNHINGEHFKRMELVDKVSMVYKVLEDAGVFPPDFRVKEWGEEDGAASGRTSSEEMYREELPRLAIILKVMGNRLKVAGEAPRLLRYFYKDDYERDEEAYERYLGTPAAADLLKKLADVMRELEDFSRSGIENAVRALAEELGVKAGDLIHPCRVALTGKTVSPDIFSVIQLLGRGKTVERLERAAEHASCAKDG
jgi:glutamyl-tRNA synthetase